MGEVNTGQSEGNKVCKQTVSPATDDWLTIPFNLFRLK